MPENHKTSLFRAPVPRAEITTALELIRSHPEYFETNYVTETYSSLKLSVLRDPFGTEVLNPIKKALFEGKPLSVLRMGDGEMNMLGYDAYVGIPNLDRHIFRAIVTRAQDSFEIDGFWMTILRDLMLGAVHRADIIGVLGFWRPRKLKPDKFVEDFGKKPAGSFGQWRGIDYMLQLARKGVFEGKILASAHLYFSVLKHLDDILSYSKKILCITSRARAVSNLEKNFPDHQFMHILVGKVREGKQRSIAVPSFLGEVEAALPKDLQGYLCLVGAGPWAELYCTWIKQRGGVGVDIGSGFDLMDGQYTRPVHRALSEDMLKFCKAFPK